MRVSRKKKSAVNRTNSQRGGAPFNSSRLNRRKLWCFRLLVAIGVPLVFLGMLELILRLVGFGYPTGFLLPSERDGQKVLVQNNQFGWRFFGAPWLEYPNPFAFPRSKAPTPFASSFLANRPRWAIPQPRFGLPRMLQAMLKLRYPGTHFEVVNAAMTAINSSVILPIARDCTALDADIWVIYMGNNEVVGPFGAGTVFGQQAPPLPLIRANLALKTTRVGQLIDTLRLEIHKPPRTRANGAAWKCFSTSRFAPMTRA